MPLNGTVRCCTCPGSAPISTLPHTAPRRVPQVDLSKRYGCLAGGVNDIRSHPWFRPLDFAALKMRTLQAPIRCGLGLP